MKEVRNSSKPAEVKIRNLKAFLILDGRAMALLLGAAKTAPIEPFTGVNVPVPADLWPQVLLLWHDLLIVRRSRGDGRQRGTSRAGVPFPSHAPARPASRSPSGLPHAGGISA